MKLVLRWYLSGFYKKPRVSRGGAAALREVPGPPPPVPGPSPTTQGLEGSSHPHAAPGTQASFRAPCPRLMGPPRVLLILKESAATHVGQQRDFQPWALGYHWDPWFSALEPRFRAPSPGPGGHRAAPAVMGVLHPCPGSAPPQSRGLPWDTA